MRLGVHARGQSVNGSLELLFIGLWHWQMTSFVSRFRASPEFSQGTQ